MMGSWKIYFWFTGAQGKAEGRWYGARRQGAHVVVVDFQLVVRGVDFECVAARMVCR